MNKMLEAKITASVNELIGLLKEGGHSIASPKIADRIGAFSIFVHDLGTEDEAIIISKYDIDDYWTVKVKPTFKEF